MQRAASSTSPLARPHPDPWALRRSPRWRAASLSAAALSLALFAGCQHATSGQGQGQPAQPSPATQASGTVIAPLAQPASPGPSNDVASLVERLKPTVVNITTSRPAPQRAMPPSFFDMLPPGSGRGGLGDNVPQARATALGTGFLVDPSGLVVTNAHVIDQADDIKVRLADERELPARLVGKDEKLDLALLRVEGATNLSAASLGDSDGLRVGESVLAIGNPFGLGHTVTLGITSAKDRTIGAGPYDAFIQTDASINPGNSGGPLFNMRGEVVGISTAIRAGAQGIGFAVPINALKDVLPQLRDKGSVSRGKLGVVIQELTPELAKGLGVDRTKGALVASVEPGSAAAKAGLQPGDVITRVEGADVGHSEELPRLVARHTPGSTIKLSLLRSGKEQEASARLDALSDEKADEKTDNGDSRGNRPAPQAADRAKLGVQLGPGPGGQGVMVAGVVPGSLAEGHLRPGDVIEQIGGKPVRSADDVKAAVTAAKAGEVLVFRARSPEGPPRFVAITMK